VLGDLLGRGGMAEVFAGHAVGDHGFQKPVAIKRLLPELANDEVFVGRLIEEAKLLVGMQHGNIVSVLDLARETDDVFLVMEFVDGPSLRQLIKARGSLGLSVGVATYIVQSAAAGLEFAHARPGGAIIHADVSPSNLLLTTSGEVRVADFGIARREGLGQGVVEGKWAYMAPEQARGEPLAPRSDVFALGVVLYELLTGRHPFGSAVTANERDDQMQVIPPRAIKPSVPRGIEAICMRALAHDPRERYSRMQQLIDALVEERFANGFREGASDLAQTIREVAPRPELGSPRTMHTDRPVTIVTRSLLLDVTPLRRSRHRLAVAQDPTQDPTREVNHDLIRELAHDLPLDVPVDPLPPNEFAVRPSAGDETVAIEPDAALLRDCRPLPSTGAYTVARVIDGGVLDDVSQPASTALYGGVPAVPSSGEHTVVREVDQVAFAEAAHAAQALLEISPMLRADGTPMPPFRLPPAALGDELASVVGGHTFTGHSAGDAVEPQPRRWSLVVLAAAALIGVAAAIGIQLKPDRRLELAALPTSRPAEVAQPPSRPRVTPIEVTVEAPRPSTSSIEAPPSAAQPPATPPVADGAAAAAADWDTAASQTLLDAAPAQERLAPPASASGGRPKSSRSSTSRDAKAKVEPGILSVDSDPWSWVTIGNQKKETPGKFYLAPGTYVAKFYSPETGLTKIEPVKIESGERQQLDVPMDR
jgi:serine/threonine protein kinase